MTSTPARSNVTAGIIVAALGYFVDIYDIILFSIVRVESLKSLGLSGDDLLHTGVYLINMQMFGMLVGGVLWGVWGDKRGRISVLFGSILLYSVANLANGMVQTVGQYAFWRFIAGVGLAGELGAGITLVSESMSKDKRGLGTTLVAAVGCAGAVAAVLVGDYFQNWRVSYFIGGGLGLLLLFMRVAVYESGLYSHMHSLDVPKGDLRMLFSNRSRVFRYLGCIMSGMPLWFIVGVLVTFSPEFGAAFGAPEAPNAGTAVMYTYIGIVLGDVASGLLSQLLQSRKKVIGLFLMLTAISCVLYLSASAPSLGYIYALCLFMGFAVGYWAVFVTTAAEQFGTNLRATVTTTVPNFVRGALVPVTWLFQTLKPGLGIIGSASCVGALTIGLAALSLLILEESFSKDLDFLET